MNSCIAQGINGLFSPVLLESFYDFMIQGGNFGGSQARGGQGQGGNRQSQTRKIFIGGLNYNSTEESLKNHFSQYGELIDVVVMKFPDTKRYVQSQFKYCATDRYQIYQVNSNRLNYIPSCRLLILMLAYTFYYTTKKKYNYSCCSFLFRNHTHLWAQYLRFIFLPCIKKMSAF